MKIRAITVGLTISSDDFDDNGRELRRKLVKCEDIASKVAKGANTARYEVNSYNHRLSTGFQYQRLQIILFIYMNVLGADYSSCFQ